MRPGPSSNLAVEKLATRVRDALGPLEGAAFLTRLAVVGDDLVEALTAVYGDRVDVSAFVADLVDDALAAAVSRPLPLRVLDRRREVDQQWFQREHLVGYVCYADRFAGYLRGVGERVDYLAELGIGYLHLMPLLRSRDGENDGGYAVADYDAVDPRLGTMADLEALAAGLHDRGIALCADLVLNHTAREHPWARKALAGHPAYEDFYWLFSDRAEPDAFERTLPEVFPDMAPGSFTFLPETGAWVWTTFHEFQWDLRWSNPQVFRAMLGVLFTFANHGVDVVRLDAAPFLWKRLGTDCQNQPEAHRILQGLRALTRLAMPGVLLKAEAIVGPDHLVPYLGAHDRYRPECDLAYDNQLMVMLWSSLATRDVRLAVHALERRRPAPLSSSWVTYLRGHDDIGWAVADEDAWAVGLDPRAHRAFLAAFYAGKHPGSFGRGADFGLNPATTDVRTSGTAASLAGLEEALEAGVPEQVEGALRRLETLYAVVYSFGGIPLLYMGDELGLRNDTAWADDPQHADDNRWLHRPPMDWDAAERRHDEKQVEGRMFAALRGLAQARGRAPALRSDSATRLLPLPDPHVLGYVRTHPRTAPVLALASFSDDERIVDGSVLDRAGIRTPEHVHSTAGGLQWSDGRLVLPAWGFLWVTDTH